MSQHPPKKTSSRRITRLVAACFLALAGTMPATSSAVTIYVSPNGASSGNGTSSGTPVNLTRAKARVREINTNLTAELQVSLAAGSYWLTSPIQFTELDSGGNGHKVVWQAQDNANPPRLSGGQVISGWVQEGTSNVWSAPVPNTAFRQLYVNNDRRTRARSKNPIDIKGQIRVDSDQTRLLLVNPATLPATLNGINRVEVHTTVDWRDYYIPLNGISSYNDPRYERALTALRVPGSAWGDVGGQVAFEPSIDNAWLENARELLDEPGEWYADASNNRVYYIPRGGENMGSAEVVIPLIENIVRVNGASLGNRVHDLEFRNLRFEHSTWTAVNGAGLVPVQGSEFQRPSYSYLPGAVEVSNAQRVHFTNNTFQHLGASALNAPIGISDASFIGNAFTDVAAGGLQIGVKGLSPSNGIPIRITVSNNLFHRIGLDYLFSVGFISYSLRDSTLTRNHFNDLPYTAIHIGDFNANGGGYNNPSAFQESGGNTVTFNKVCNFLKYLRDGGGIYINGCNRGSDGVTRSTFVSDNFFSQWWTDEAAIYSEDHSGNITYQKNVAELTLNTPDLTRDRKWLYAWSGASFNITLGSGGLANYHTNNIWGDYRVGDRDEPGHGYQDGVSYAPGARPAGATSIINASGIDPAYPRASALQALLPGGTNQAPTANAGPDITTDLSSTITLEGVASDDGRPYNRLVTEWSKISGPGDVTFDDFRATKVTAAFSAPGTYELEFNVKDGTLQTGDRVLITVLDPNLGASVVAGVIPTVSSTYFDDWNPAWVTDGAFSNDYKWGIWLSQFQNRPWIQLDAGSAIQPGRLVIGSRGAANADERSNFAILGSNDPGFATFTILAEQGHAPYSAWGQWTGTTNTSRKFRYYRAESGNGFLSTSEFQVYRQGFTKVSVYGVASASSSPIVAEGAEKAFDGASSTKWLGNFSNGITLRYNLPSNIARIVTHYKLTSANDAPERDPKSWELQGSNDGNSWNNVDSRSNQSFSGRFVTNSYTVSSPAPFQYYRLRITEISGASTLVQLAELCLQVGGTPPPARVSSGGTATASSTPVAAEGAVQGFDINSGTKWLGDFGGESWLRYQFGSGTAQIVTQYKITSANDAPERNPKNWVLEGSNDGNSWVGVDSRNNENFPGFFLTRSFTVSNPAAFRYYRLRVTATAGASSLLQLADLELLAGN
ncbi:MAG: discoidin domain-containing protein [Verrucomicrobiota bacterium]